MTDPLRHETFEGQEGSIFTVHVNESESLDIELIEIALREFPGQYAFSILFKGPQEVYFEQGQYSVVHDQLGEMSLFLVPIMNSSAQPGMLYEYIVNNLVETD